MAATDLLEPIAAAAIGVVAGSSELLVRHPDSPLRALRAGFIYLLLNAVVAAVALLFVKAFGWSFGEPLGLWRVVVAGIGAMAVLRSSTFLLGSGANAVQVGPAALVQSYLDAASSAVDQQLAPGRSEAVRESILGLPYDDVRNDLTEVCFKLVNPSPQRKAEVITELQRIHLMEAKDATKALLIGIELLKLAGAPTLRNAAQQVRTK